MKHFSLILTLFLVAVVGVSGAQQPAHPLEITLKNGSEREQQAKEMLEALVKKYDLAPWFFTREILIEQRSIPHSHPILRLNTNYPAGDASVRSHPAG